MDNPGPGGGGCGGECQMNEDGVCEVCEMWREISSFNPKSDGAKQFLVSASDGSSGSGSSSSGGGGCRGECYMDNDGAKQFLVPTSDGSSGSGGSGGECEMNDDGAKQFLVVASDGSRDSSSIPEDVGAVPPFAPCDHHALNEHDQPSNDIFYTTLPGCFLTKAQDEKVLEIAHTKKPKSPLHVASMNKMNVYLNDSRVYIPIQLVRNHFNGETTKATIQLEAPDNGIYSVGASKHTDDQVVLDSGWDNFVASQHIQQKDLLVFRSTDKSRLEVLILDPSGHEKPSSCFAMENSSSTQETSGDSVHIVDPPPPAIIDLSSSDDDDIVRGGMRESCSAQERVTLSCVKAQKMASTSSLGTESGSEGRRPHDAASVSVKKLRVGKEHMSNNLGGPWQRPYILPKNGTTLPWQIKKKIEEKVQEIGSEVPIYVNVMTTGCLDGAGSHSIAMGFCKEYASAYLPSSSRLLLLQLEGEQMQWETRMAVRRKDGWRWIGKGWRGFTRTNGLEVGDICLFQLASGNSETLTMKVHLIRKSEI